MWCEWHRYLQAVQFKSVNSINMEEAEIQASRYGRCWQSTKHEAQL